MKHTQITRGPRIAIAIVVVAFDLISAGAATIETLKSFGFADLIGESPQAPLIQGSDGMLYGTTAQANGLANGTVFRMSQDGAGYTVLHRFGTIPNDGLAPYAGLVEGRDG